MRKGAPTRLSAPLLGLLGLFAQACGGSSDAVETPTTDAPSTRRAARAIVPRSAYAECVVGLRERPTDPNVAGARTFDDARRVEMSGNIEGAITAYLDFISQNTGSPLIPDAYFSLGIVYERQAESDPDRWIHAEQAFNAALRSPTSLDIVTWTELAKVFNKRTKWTETLSAANKVGDRVRAAPRTPCADIAMEHVTGHLLQAYVETGDPARAFGLFRRFYGAVRHDEAALLTERLAKLYDERGDTRSANAARGSIVFPTK